MCSLRVGEHSLIASGELTLHCLKITGRHRRRTGGKLTLGWRSSRSRLWHWQSRGIPLARFAQAPNGDGQWC